MPAILVYLKFPVRSPSERFINMVSTGTAAHSDLHEAVLGVYWRSSSATPSP